MDKVENKITKIGLYFAGITGSAAILLSIISAPFISPALRKVIIYTTLS